MEEEKERSKERGGRGGRQNGGAWQGKKGKGSKEQWRRNEINIAGARRGQKGRSSKPEGLSQMWGSSGGDGKTHPHQLGDLGSAVSSPSGVHRPKAPAAKSFGAFWVPVSSPAVLLLDLNRMNRDL